MQYTIQLPYALQLCFSTIENATQQKNNVQLKRKKNCNDKAGRAENKKNVAQFLPARDSACVFDQTSDN
jgi:hypothetical protein